MERAFVACGFQRPAVHRYATFVRWFLFACTLYAVPLFYGYGRAKSVTLSAKRCCSGWRIDHNLRGLMLFGIRLISIRKTDNHYVRRAISM